MSDARAAIAFAGTPQFAVPSLAALLGQGYALTLVLTQPDRGAGRGRRVAMSPVKALALEHGLRVEQPESLPERPGPESAWGRRPELLVVVAYGLLLPQWLLDWPTVAPVNVHASLLPRWRGAAPIQRAILAGDSESGISIMKMERGLDTGPVYAAEAISIGDEETAGKLHDRLAELGARLLLETLPQILDGSCRPQSQAPNHVSLAPKITKREARLDWRADAAALARKVRAFDPWPVAQARLDDGRVLRIWRAVALDGAPGGEPGTIVASDASGIEVATGRGRLRIERLQAPGGRPMSAAAYLNAHSFNAARFVV